MKKISLIVPISKKTKPIIKENLSDSKGKIDLIIVEGENPSRNRNIGIKKSKNDLIAFTNAHSILGESWHRNVTSFFNEYPEFHIVGGPQKTHPSESSFGKASGFALESLFGSAGVSNRYNGLKIVFDANEIHLTSANLICKKEVLKKVKFDEKLYPGEDPKFISDCISSGFKLAFHPDIVIYNRRRNSFFPLAKQIFNYGFVRPKKESFKKTLIKPAFLIPSVFLMYLISLPFIYSYSTYLLFPGVLYLILDILFSTLGAIKNRSIYQLFLLILIYPVIHISYGLGYLIGLLNRIFRI